MKYCYLFTLFILLISCSNFKSTKEEFANESEVDSLQLIIEESQSFLENRDLDGDGKSDKIFFDYTQGAHCCYLMSLMLSSDSLVIKYPFEMDGGYLFGVDGSMPDHFYIKDYDGDNLPEIFMEIYTYNGRKSPLEKSWIKEYRIKTNYILFDYHNGKMNVMDFEENK